MTAQAFHDVAGPVAYGRRCFADSGTDLPGRSLPYLPSKQREYQALRPLSGMRDCAAEKPSSAANPKFAHIVPQVRLRTSGSKAALES